MTSQRPDDLAAWDSAYVAWMASCGLGVVELLEPEAAVYEGWRRRIPTRAGLAARPVHRLAG